MSATDTAGCTPRAVMEAAANAALARYLEAVGDGTPRLTAERAYRDHVLKAWDRTAGYADAARRRDTIRPRDIDAALRQVREHA